MTNIEDSAHRRRRWALIGGISGGVVLVAGLAGLVVVGLGGGDAQPTEPAASSQPNTSTAAPEPMPTEAGEATEPNAETGWVAEPETTDPREYAAAAVEAVYSYDSTASSRDEFRDYMLGWFDTRPDATSAEQLEVAQENLGQSLNDVVMDISEWDQQRLAQTAQIATAERERMTVDGEHSFGGPDERLLELGMHLVTVPVGILYDEVDVGTGEAVQYEYRLLQTVQVVCGNEEIPTDESMAPGSCKLIGFWAEPAA